MTSTGPSGEAIAYAKMLTDIKDFMIDRQYISCGQSGLVYRHPCLAAWCPALQSAPKPLLRTCASKPAGIPAERPTRRLAGTAANGWEGPLPAHCRNSEIVRLRILADFEPRARSPDFANPRADLARRKARTQRWATEFPPPGTCVRVRRPADGHA